MRQTRHGLRAAVRASAAQRQFEIRAEAFNLTNTAAFNLPGSSELQRREKLREHHDHAQSAASVQLGAKFYW